MDRSLIRLRSLLVVLVFSLIGIVMLIAPAAAQDSSGVTFTALTPASLPWDAVPSPDGTTIYFTALQNDGIPAVFSVPGAGGNATVLAEGDPFVMPLGLDVSSDGKTLYVADPWMAGAAGNAIFAMSTNGDSTRTAVAGTQGTAPQGVTVVNENGSDQIYFSGINRDNGQPAVYKVVASATNAPTILAQGSPLVAPSGLAVAKDGTIYVLDRLASGNGLGSVLRIQGDKVDLIASDVRIGGQLAGLALTFDESLLLVSSLDKTAGTAQVLAINLSTMQSSIINDVIKANTAAGGLHRAHDANIFAWADCPPPPSTSFPGGKVFKVTLSS